MKKILFLTLFLTTIKAFAQNYVLDETFGSNGTIVHNDVSFYPTDALLVNNNYYFISAKNLVKLNYNGSLSTNFGVNGVMSFDNEGQEFIISGFKYLGGYFYLYGSVRELEEGREDAFMCRIDENGNFDNAFGTDNFAIIDFEAQEAINDFTIDETGNLFCIGSRFDGEEANSVRLIYFKISASGTLITSFDPNGFKEIVINAFSDGRYITNYNNRNFLLAGTDTYFDPETNIRQQRLLLTQIDTNGNPILSFGTNGSTRVALHDGTTVTLKDIELRDSDLFVNYFHSSGFINQGSAIIKYNLTGNETLFNLNTYYNASFKLANDGLLITGSHRCDNVYDSSCPRDFNLTKVDLNGLPDATFNSNVNYTYNFPSEFYSDDLSNTLIKQDDGSILIAGHSTGIYFEDFHPSGFALLRLNPVTMATKGIKQDDVTVYPNPFTDIVNVISRSQIRNIEIFDVTGRCILTPGFSTANGVTKINVQAITNRGSYVVKVTTNNDVTFTKVILKE
jgi:hypothetical protein